MSLNVGFTLVDGVKVSSKLVVGVLESEEPHSVLELVGEVDWTVGFKREQEVEIRFGEVQGLTSGAQEGQTTADAEALYMPDFAGGTKGISFHLYRLFASSVRDSD